MKSVEVRELSDKERDEKVRDYEEELFNLRFQMATGKKNPGRIRIIRRDMARIKTIQKELASKAGNSGDEAKTKDS